MTFFNRIVPLALCFFACIGAVAQEALPEKTITELKYNLDSKGSRYIKATILNQTWLRWNESNPGSLVNGEPQATTVDIGMRRTRFQLYGQLTDHVFFYTQYGLNNFNFLAQNAGNRKIQAFFHDVVGEYRVFKGKDYLKVGGGLTVLNGLSRFSQPGVTSIMTTDVPVFLQVTVDQTDEFARRLAVYGRGQLGRFDYRVAISDPFPIQTNGVPPAPIGKDATFTTYGHTRQFNAFFMYNLLDREPNTTPYMAGTYLGDKKVLNIEAGVIYQSRATWSLANTDTVFHNMLHWSAAVYADMPLKQNKYAVSTYAGYFFTDYGRGYIRNNGIMNPANGVNGQGGFNGAGNAYPMFGTGNSIYAQLGLRLPDSMLGKAGTLMPYVSYRWSGYEKLAGAVNVYDAGVNWLLNRHQSKLSFNYQLRPVFTQNPAGEYITADNASSAWLQYQVFF
ncbi:MAG: hypothetical protein H7257_05320 [Taibaiella sp.]|nr:hypothetical protein [Taibaiella sp.]